MLPVVAGRAETTRQILIYSILLFPISLLPWALGFAGAIYGATAVLCGAAFITLALRLAGSNETDRRPAHRLFAFSILYLFLLFAALGAGNGGHRWSFMVSAHATTAAVAPVDPTLCVTRDSNRPEGA
jgi:protoheme IX farnesyltransferase